jgi:hypothetical protein
MVTSGIRLGSPAFTTRGFKEAEAIKVGHLIAGVLDNPNDAATIERVKAEVKKLTSAFLCTRSNFWSSSKRHSAEWRFFNCRCLTDKLTHYGSIHEMSLLPPY